jgi:hypothetical protein
VGESAADHSIFAGFAGTLETGHPVRTTFSRATPAFFQCGKRLFNPQGEFPSLIQMQVCGFKIFGRQEKSGRWHLI